MPGRDIIVIGASSGGLDVLVKIVSSLPHGFPASLFIVSHIPDDRTSFLPEILSRSGPLLAQHAVNGEPFYPGHIYVAPPGFHLLIQQDKTALTRGPRENNHRPAIDPLFLSAARVYGNRVVGVILTGALSDGVAGLMSIRAAGGIAIVQDPSEALVAALPSKATQIAGADFILPSTQIASRLIDLANQEVHPDKVIRDPIDRSTETVEQNFVEQQEGRRRGGISTFTCPECGGNLWQVDEAEPLRFRCHVGHVYYANTLAGEQSAALEAALWTTVRTFREKSVLCRQLADQAFRKGDSRSSERFEEEARTAERYGELIRAHVLHAAPIEVDARGP